MKVISAEALAKIATYGAIVEALREGFKADIATPVRHHHETSPVSTLLLMPAWSREWTGLKTVVVKTDNAAMNLPTVQASYLLIRNDTAETVAIMDGTELTRRRTAAASALAADYLARPDASTLALVGAGALGNHFVRAHAAVRPIKKIFIYNRSPEKAAVLANELKGEGFEATSVTDLEAARGLWQKLLDPTPLLGPSMWQVGDGPAIRLVHAKENQAQGLVITVGSLARAKTFLRTKGLLGAHSDKEATIDPSKIQGLSISVEEKQR